MSAQYSIDFNSVLASIDALDRAHGRIDARLTQLETTVEARLAVWEGSARDNYRAAKATWDQAAKEMNDQLDRSRATLATVQSGYSTTERHNAASWT